MYLLHKSDVVHTSCVQFYINKAESLRKLKKKTINSLTFKINLIS